MNFEQKLWTPEDSHQSDVLETALCLLSIMPASRHVCVLDGGTMARKVTTRAAALWTRVDPRVLLACVSVAQSCVCVRHHTQYHHRHPHPYRFIASLSLLCRRLWLVSWWGWVLPSLLAFVAPCIIIKQHLLPSSCLVLPFGTPGAHTRAAAILWSNVRKERVST